MIKGKDLMGKLGKRKFTELVTNSQKGETGAQREHRRRFGRGTTIYKICQHGKTVIRDAKPTNACDSCGKEVVTKSPEFKPYFNIGLGAYVESRSDEKKLARSMGLTEAG